MPTCSSCGGNFDDTFKFCPYCGREKQKPQEPIKVDMVMRESHSPMECPKCHRVDSISKASAIVQGGTHSINGQIPVSYTSHDSEGWHSGTSYESYHATQQSTLASRLMPPKKPTKAYSCLVNLAIVPFFFSPIVGMLGLSAAFEPSFDMGSISRIDFCLGVLLYLVFLIVVWRVCVLIDKPFKARHAINLAAWEYSMSKWGEIYYCSRDDCIFIPGEGFVYTISHLNNAIKWSPAKKFNPLFNTNLF
jgi:hypothetical protein